MYKMVFFFSYSFSFFFFNDTATTEIYTLSLHDALPIPSHVLLFDRQPAACGDANLFPRDIDAGDGLSHRMFDLQPRVHLQEIEVLLRVDQEFDRAGAVVVGCAGDLDRRLAHSRAQVGVVETRRAFFDHLLVASLDGAFAFAQVDDIAVFVAKYLDLDMTRAFDEFLDIDRRVAERRLGFGGSHGEGRAHLFVRGDDAHAFSAAACRSFEHHRIADLSGELSCRYIIGQRFGRAGDDRRARLDGGHAGVGLVAHQFDGFRGRADEFDSGLA